MKRTRVQVLLVLVFTAAMAIGGMALAQEAPPASTLDGLLTKASQEQAAGNAANGEHALRQAAGLLKSTDDCNLWAAAVWSFVRNSKPFDDGLAAFGRLSALATSADAKERLGRVFVENSRPYLVGSEFENGLKILNATKALATGPADLAARASFLECLGQAQALGESGDHPGAAKSFECATLRAAGKDDWLRDIYTIGLRVAYDRVWAHENDLAASYVGFLIQEPGAAVNPLSFNIDMARILNALGKLAEAESHLAKAAPLIKTKDEAKAWADLVWATVIYNKSVDEGVAAFKRLSPLAVTSETRATLAAVFLGGCRNYLTGGEYEKGIAILGTAREMASGMQEVADLVQFLDQMAQALTLGKAGNVDGCIQSFQAAQGLAAGKPDQLKDLYNAAFNQTYTRVRAKDAASVEKFVSFLVAGPGTAMEPFALHDNLAWVRFDLGQMTAAREEVLKAAVAIKSDKDWQQLYWVLGGVVASQPAEAGVELVNKLSAMAASEEAKKVLAKVCVGVAGRYMAVEVGKGVQMLDLAKGLGIASDEVKIPISILEQLAQARTLAEANDFNASVNALKIAAGLAAGKADRLNNIYETGVNLVNARVAAKDKPGADAFLAFLTQEPTIVDPWRVQMEAARTENALQDFAAAEVRLAKAAPLIKNEGDADFWADLVLSLVSSVKSADDASGAFGRLAALATTKDAKESLATCFLRGSRQCLAANQLENGQRILNAAKPVATEFADMAPLVQFLDELAVAQTLAKAGDGTGAIEALQAAQGVAAQKQDWMKDVYRVARSLAYARIWAGDKKSPEQLAGFLTQGCGAATDPWTYHTDLAKLQSTLGNLQVAEAGLSAAAPLTKTPEQAAAWSGLLWQVVAGGKSIDDGVALLKRLAPLAPAPAAKAKLAELAVAGTRNWLAGGDFRKGLKVLGTTCEMATGMTDLQPTVQFIGHLAKAHELGLAKNIDGCIDSLKAAHAIAAGKPDLAKDVYNVAFTRMGNRAEWKDRPSCDKLIKFVLDGPGKSVQPFALHNDLAWTRFNLGQNKEARDEVMKAAAQITGDADWQRLYWILGGVVSESRPPQTGTELLDVLHSMATTDTARQLTGLVRAGFLIRQRKPADAEAVLNKILPKEGKPDERMLMTAYCISDRYASLGQIADACRTFARAEAIAKAFTEAERDHWFRFAYYGWDGKKIPFNVHALLKEAIQKTPDTAEKGRLLALYCEAAGANGAADDGIAFLREANAGAGMYVRIVREMLRHSDVTHAKKVVDAIMPEALNVDPAAAEELAKLWPGPRGK